MHVYFVRHGETLALRRHRHQSPNTPLSPTGREQANSTAEYVRSLNPDILLSSEYTRALETARIIGMQTGLTPITNGLFYEIMRPSKFFEKKIYSIETLWYIMLSVMHHKNHSWKYADAENFVEISTRAQKARVYLESLSSTHTSVVVVSHTVFINLMIAYLCNNNLLNIFDMARTFLFVEQLKNGGVIHVEYTGTGGANTCSWNLITEK